MSGRVYYASSFSDLTPDELEDFPEFSDDEEPEYGTMQSPFVQKELDDYLRAKIYNIGFKKYLKELEKDGLPKSFSSVITSIWKKFSKKYKHNKDSVDFIFSQLSEYQDVPDYDKISELIEQEIMYRRLEDASEKIREEEEMKRLTRQFMHMGPGTVEQSRRRPRISELEEQFSQMRRPRISELEEQFSQMRRPRRFGNQTRPFQYLNPDMAYINEPGALIRDNGQRGLL